MIFHINKIDRDYNTVTNSFTEEFSSIEEAEKWCTDNTWSGYYYFIDRSYLKAEKQVILESDWYL